VIFNAEMGASFVKISQLFEGFQIVVCDQEALIEDKFRNLKTYGIFHLSPQLWYRLKQGIGLHANLKLLKC
jgi:hypothetical protein